jgi:hypothetical protein
MSRKWKKVSVGESERTHKATYISRVDDLGVDCLLIVVLDCHPFATLVDFRTTCVIYSNVRLGLEMALSKFADIWAVTS